MSKISILALLSLFFIISPAGAETLTLRECLRKAASDNRELKAASYNVKIAEENITIGKSGYLPRVDLQSGYTAQQDPQSVKFNGFSFATQDADYGFFSASLYQTIYDFGRTPARYGRARALAEAASQNYTTNEKDVFLRVVEAYYGVMESEKLLKSADEEVVQMTDHLKVAQNLYDQGVVTRNDLLQAEVQLANSRQRRLAAANTVENRRLYLNYLIGLDPSSRPALEVEDDKGLEPVPAVKAIEAVLSDRPEMKAMKKGIQAGELSVRESRSAWFPEIFARLGADYVENSRVKEQTIMYATIGLQVNLFDGFATTGRYRQSVEALSRDRQNLSDLDARIRLEYETARNDARVAAERIATVRSSIRHGEENLRINKDRYQEQVGTATNVIDAQTLLTQTKTEYHRAVFDYQVAVARVKKAMGEL